MNLLFITHARLTDLPYGDGSTRYRCFNLAEVARQAGYRASVLSASSVTTDHLDNFDIVSWLRPLASAHLFRLIDKAKARGMLCVADLDDLIINPDLANQSPAVINQFVKPSHLRRRFSKHAAAMECFDALTVSTSALEEQVSELYPDKPVATVRNGLSDYWMQHVQTVSSDYPTQQIASYLPGTRSHDEDLRSIAPALRRWLTGNSQRQLSIVGKLALDDSLRLSDRVMQRSWVDYYSLPSVISSCNCSLAPLSNTIFNQAKSHIKFIEAAALGVPSIATQIPDYSDHNVQGLLLPTSQELWFESLELATNQGFRMAHAENLRAYAADYCSAAKYTTPLLQAWDSGQPVPMCTSSDTRTQAA
ncbi:MAG: glycosyltransferase [Granulosicoccus sp.]